MIRILYLCSGNSCRSQMAEGWTRHLRGDQIEAYSAGIEPKGLDARAVKVMAERGVDISRHVSKHVSEFEGLSFDYAITVCDSARDRCPVFSGAAKTIHFGFQDPPVLAQTARTEQEALDAYRKVRDQIRALVKQLPVVLGTA